MTVNMLKVAIRPVCLCLVVALGILISPANPAVSRADTQAVLLGQEIARLRVQCGELEAEIKRLEQEKDERNVIDCLAHQVLEAMGERDVATLREQCARTISVRPGELAYGENGIDIVFPYPKTPLRDLRQRGYELLPDGSYVTFMEYSDEDGYLRALEMVFVKEEGVWKLASIAHDA